MALSPWEILDETDWASLQHAYGPADGLPELLIRLLSGDPDAAVSVLATLDAAVLHQGTIYTSTAPTALFVASVLPDSRVDLSCGSALPWDDRVRPLRAALLEWLGAVAASAAQDEADEADVDPATRASRAIRRQLYGAVLPFLQDAHESVRAEALQAVGHLLRAPDLVDERRTLAQSLLVSPATVAERSQLALILDDWTIPPRALLSDPDPAVRACAAIASTLDDDPMALAEVRAALRDPDAVNGWFGGHHPRGDGWFLDTLVKVLLRRTTTFDDIETEAFAIARASHNYARENSLFSLRLRAFPPDIPDSPAQARFREELDRLKS